MLAMKRSALGTALIFATLTAGCTSMMDRYTARAPEWFHSAAREVKGEGYPELADVPVTRAPVRTEAQQTASAQNLRETRSVIEQAEADPAPLRTPDDIRATAAQLRAAIENGSEASGDTPP
jgi:hypothetical protein